MKPFDPQIASLYRQTGMIWESGKDEHDVDLALGTLVAREYRRAFSEPLPAPLPEPYDMEMGDLLYVFPKGRYLFISHADGDRPTAEIRSVQPLYFLNRIDDSAVLSTFHAPDRPAALFRVVEEILPSLPFPPDEWLLYERPRPGMDAVLVLKGT